MITLLCPEGAHEYPITFGTQEFFPYRLDITLSQTARDMGGPWAVDVVEESVQHFLRGGFSLMPSEDRMAVPAGMVRLRKADGSDASCGYQGLAYPADDDGTVLVPMTALGELVESHGYVVDEVAEADSPEAHVESAEDEAEEDEPEEDEEEDGEAPARVGPPGPRRGRPPTRR